jgi:transcription-repair coupling factor (superfamily II helicase)
VTNFFDLSFAAGRTRVGGAPDGLSARAVASVARQSPGGVIHIATSDARADAMAHALAFFAPDVAALDFPAWDCMPYDRVSPSHAILGQRTETLSQLATGDGALSTPTVLLTTVNAAVQRIPARESLAGTSFSATVGGALELYGLLAYLHRDGYERVGTVHESGEYAVRGGIVDVFPTGHTQPMRLDLFGDVLESARLFDPLTQRTVGTADGLSLRPANEVILNDVAIARFKAGYAAQFGATGDDDPLYQAVIDGRRPQGAEHWLPLFHDRLATLFEYLPDAVVMLDYQAEEMRATRSTTIQENFDARKMVRRDAKAMGQEAVVYQPLEPDALYLNDGEWDAWQLGRRVIEMSPYQSPDPSTDLGGRPGRDLALERTKIAPSDSGGIQLEPVRDHIIALQAQGVRVIVAAMSTGSRDRLTGLLMGAGVESLATVNSWEQAKAQAPITVATTVLGLEHGFEALGLAVISEQDILGERLSRPPRKTRRAEDFIREASSLSPGDLVVHVDHGIGRFTGLEILDVHGRPHDCLTLVYGGDDRLFLPVENIEMISRYGADEGYVNLDRLGGAGWQGRKAKAKKRIGEIAGELLKLAAARQLRASPKLVSPPGLYDEFCVRFPYHLTDDQQQTIEEVMADLVAGRPMDRLVCGDVGFGKTEVAMRAAFVAAMAGKQVAVVAPTTLLARQHTKVFKERFDGWPVRVAQLSRMVSPTEAAETVKGMKAGTVDIVIGTHALLGKSIVFKDLGLLVVDEEQRFGVGHKEQLKGLGSDVHVLTLTATPIPRTLQMALAGIRELSLIATPPVDRLAVRTFISPFDPMVVREAILRERNRGGQTFYVCPRIADLEWAKDYLAGYVSEAKVVVAHGRLSPAKLEEAMGTFYDGGCDVLLATNIIESGLDIPTANTIIIHRADMFGLSELYQLRGRIGRSKVRGYAYLTVAPRRIPTKAAEKRLHVMQALDGLGAGFSVASHDMDIRGAGNLLGDDQSGHIREVGYELYQQMLEEAVNAARVAGGEAGEVEEVWSPQINVGTAVVMPETYVPDLDVRMDLYRRLSQLADHAEIEAYAAELIDRFGPLPDEVEKLLAIVAIKLALLAAGVEKLEAGPRGATVAFRDSRFANPEKLIRFISDQADGAFLRPDHILVIKREWSREKDRLAGSRQLAEELASLAA